MLHPVGSQAPGVYWRRRLVLLAAVVVVLALIWLTALAVLDKHTATSAASGSSGHTPPATNPPAITHTTSAPPSTEPVVQSSAPASTQASAPPASSTQASSGASSGAATSATPPSSTAASPTPPASSTAAGSSAPPPLCAAAQLSLQAVAQSATYAVGQQPVLGLKVTNTGTAPCVQDVADSQIELRVYNGASRVWGSHDCMIEPGTTDKVLEPNNPATFTVQWTGLSSQPKCAGTRQRVGAGSYTLYGSLAGHDGKAANFSIS